MYDGLNKKYLKNYYKEYKRQLFYDLEKNLNKRQILSITGLRRIGKITLIFQLIQKLIEDKIETKNIFYFSFDEYTENLDELIEFYKQIKNKDLRDENIYIFLDEIQKLNNWENQIKKYYDLYPKIKFIISGSESLFISTKTKERLAGRLFEYILKPLFFKEFLMIKEESTNQTTSKINLLLNEYLET